MVWKIGVEGHAVALGELMAGAIADERHAPVLDEAGLARARLVHRRVAGAAGTGPGLNGVAGDLGALAGERRSEDLPAMAVGAARAAVGGPHNADRAALVEGDCVTFDADLPHHFENPGEEDAVLLAVVSAGLRRS